MTACDVIFMLYNKCSDKICFVPEMVDVIVSLDEKISKHVLHVCADDLQKLSEFIVRKEFETLNKELDKHYN